METHGGAHTRVSAERPAPPAGSQHSCQPTVKLHILPLVWVFLWERGSTGAQGAAAGIFLGIRDLIIDLIIEIDALPAAAH